MSCGYGRKLAFCQDSGTSHADSLASAVLLNGTLALRTFFGIGLNPVGSLTVVLAFLQPKFCDRADDGSMIGVNGASKAECVAFRTSHRGYLCHERNLACSSRTGDGKRAFGCRAVLELCHIVDILSQYQQVEAFRGRLVSDIVDEF